MLAFSNGGISHRSYIKWMACQVVIRGRLRGKLLRRWDISGIVSIRIWWLLYVLEWLSQW